MEEKNPISAPGACFKAGHMKVGDQAEGTERKTETFGMRSGIEAAQSRKTGSLPGSQGAPDTFKSM